MSFFSRLANAFVDAETLGRVDRELDWRGYTTHEFGDSVFVERVGGRMCIVSGKAAHVSDRASTMRESRMAPTGRLNG